MHLEILTPETKVFSGEVEAVQLPGLDGSFQVLKGHAPIISALTNGKVKVDLSSPLSEDDQENKLIEKDGAKIIRVSIKGGVVELMNDKIIILAE
jgi:F-type H+-transporting ATPase subunit epsilon